MITSPHNEKLKLVRKLRDRRHREREGLFVTEGEDLLAAGLAAGAEPRFVLDRRRQRAGRRGGGCRAARGRLRPRLGQPGDRGLAAALGRDWRSRSASTCTASPTRATSVRSCAPPTRSAAARSSSARAAPTRTRRRRCGRAWARSSASRCSGRGSKSTPAPRAALVAHGGEGLDALGSAATLCLGAEREGLPGRGARGNAIARSRSRCAPAPRSRSTSPRRRRSSASGWRAQRASPILRKRASGSHDVEADIVARHAGGCARCLSESLRSRRGRRGDRGRGGHRPSWRSCGSATSAAKPS